MIAAVVQLKIRPPVRVGVHPGIFTGPPIVIPEIVPVEWKLGHG
jgi:hypothetical protein